MSTAASGLAAVPALAPGACVGRFRVVSEAVRRGAWVVHQVESAEDPQSGRARLCLMHLPFSIVHAKRIVVHARRLADAASPTLARIVEILLIEGPCLATVAECQGSKGIVDYCHCNALSLHERLVLFRAACLAVHELHIAGYPHLHLDDDTLRVRPNRGIVLLDGLNARLVQILGSGYDGALRMRRPCAAEDVLALGRILSEMLRDESRHRTNAWTEEADGLSPSALVHGPALRSGHRHLLRLCRHVAGEASHGGYASVEAVLDEMEGILEDLGKTGEARKRWRAGRPKFRALVGVSVSIAVAAAALLFNDRLAVQRDLAVAEQRSALLGRETALERARLIVDLFQPSEYYGARSNRDVARILDEATHRLASEVGIPSELRAAKLFALAEAYRNAGRLGEARSLLEQCVALLRGAGPQRTFGLARALTSLAHVHLGLESPGDAVRLAQEAVDLLQASELRADARDVASASGVLGTAIATSGQLAKAEGMLATALSLTRKAYGANSREHALAQKHWAMAPYVALQYEVAGERFREAMPNLIRTLGAGHPETIAAQITLAAIDRHAGDLAGSEIAYRDALAKQMAQGGQSTLLLETTREGLGALYWMRGRFREALHEQSEALRMLDGLVAPDSARRAWLEVSLARTYSSMGALADAEPLLRTALLAVNRIAVPGHQLPRVEYHLSEVLMRSGRLPEAQALAERAVLGFTQAAGELHMQTAMARAQLGEILRRRGARAEAEQQLLAARDVQVAGQGRNEAILQSQIDDSLAALDAERGEFAHALDTRQRALTRLIGALGNEHPDVAVLRSRYARVLAEGGHLDEASQELERARRVLLLEHVEASPERAEANELGARLRVGGPTNG